MCRYAPRNRPRGAHAPRSPRTPIELPATVPSRLRLVPSATNLPEYSGMPVLPDRERPGVLLLARALPAQPNLGGGIGSGARPPPSFLGQPGAQAAPARPVSLTVPRPVDQEGFTADLLPLDEAPVAAVLGVVAVVPHDEVRAGRHHRRLAAVEVAAVGRGHGGNGSGTDVRLVDETTVEHHPVVHHLHGVAAHRHDALDEVAGLVVRILEDHDVPALGLAQPG